MPVSIHLAANERLPHIPGVIPLTLSRKMCRMASAIFCGVLLAAGAAEAGVIENDVFWKDASGNLLLSQGGGMLKLSGTYYWYGINYTAASTYATDPLPSNTGNPSFKSVRCYSSTDLVRWKYEGDVLQRDQVGGTWFGRMGVVHNAATGKFVLLAQGASPGNTTGEYFAVSDSPTGPFTFDHVQSKLPGIKGGGTGDQTTFQDDDGAAYLICSNKSGRGRLYVAPLRSGDFLAVENATEISHGTGREGNCMFKYQGRYYFCSSDLHGWNASPTYVISASHIKGQYGRESVMRNTPLDFSHVTQTGFFFNVNGSSQTTVIFAGDRWCDFGGNGIGYNQWCPLSFDGAEPVFNSLTRWSLDAVTGAWSIAPGNNYVLNPSFEADRVSQSTLAGWVNATDVSGGDPNGNLTGNAHSGKFCMQQKYATDYSAGMSQTITGLPAGDYTLSAWVRSSGGQKTATIAAKDFGSDDLAVSIARPIDRWTLVTIPGIHVTKGTCTVAILSDAHANNWVQVDDVSLVDGARDSAEASPPIPHTSPAHATAFPAQQFTSVAAARREAIRRYPALGVLGSPFNNAFIALYNRYKLERPGMFADPSWPLQIAMAVSVPGNSASSPAGTR